jgi:hypothetical protein
MLDLAAIGKMRQTVPVTLVIVSRDFGLHRPANEYRSQRVRYWPPGITEHVDYFEQ